AATSESTSAANATLAGTASANGTAQPGQALLIDSHTLIGMQVVDSSKSPVGTVADVLVTMSGTVQSVIVNVAGLAGTPGASPTRSAASTSAATPSTSGTAAAGNTPVAAGTAATANPFVSAPWSSLMADPSNNQLVYQGSGSTLAGGPAFDEQ